ncbi:hypothetical protein ACFYN3_42700 [Streptomyces lavendulae]|uniref:hypothetical protein n=1 Tax=Streptomyces lavendulae TaxID=1914 RepID=UPI0036B84779
MAGDAVAGDGVVAAPGDADADPVAAVGLFGCVGRGVAGDEVARDGGSGLGGEGFGVVVRPNTKYKIRFDKSTADTSVINSRRPPAASSLIWSPVQSAGPGSKDIDSDAVPETTNAGQYATAEVTTGAPGTVDHTIDAGLYINRL